jgi:hypothetical protein
VSFLSRRGGEGQGNDIRRNAMERGSNKVGSKLNQEMERESATLETSNQEGHVEEHLEKERDSSAGDGHRIQGTGANADEYPWKDHGEVGGESHPKPKESDDAEPSERAKNR